MKDHATQLVDLVDKQGRAIGTKLRREVRKQTDLYHTIFIIVKTPEGQFLLSEIPPRKDMSVYCATHLQPDDYSRTDIASVHLFSRQDLAEMLEKSPERFAPTFIAIWKKYSAQL